MGFNLCQLTVNVLMSDVLDHCANESPLTDLHVAWLLSFSCLLSWAGTMLCARFQFSVVSWAAIFACYFAYQKT